MNHAPMTSRQRVMAAMSHQEPDRVPQLLTTTLTGARELGLSLPHFYSRAENVVEAQLRMQRKFRNDCYLGFLYGALEYEAFGGEAIMIDDGPPNAGAPVITDPEQIRQLQPPDPRHDPALRRALDLIVGLKERGDPEVPILGLTVGPFSLPVMQLGFPAYLDLMHDRPDLMAHLMAVNEEFCVAWANAQFAAGITAVTYYEPVASPTNVPPATFRSIGLPVARRVMGRLHGPAAFHLASGRVLPVLDDIIGLGPVGVGVGDLEAPAEVKAACRGRTTMIGNLNGIGMTRWTADQAEAEVKALLAAAAPGGGFILSDGHGEIPWQVPDDIILAVSEAVHTWGRYPLDWVGGHEP